MIRRRGVSRATAPAESASIGQNVSAVKRSVPPSGNSSHSTKPPASAGIASRAAVPSAARPPASSVAAAPSSRNAPATGLAHIAPSASRTDATRHCTPGPRDSHHQAPIASATPSRNGIRPIATFDITPAANSHEASAAAVVVGAAARASGPNAATASTADATPTSAGPAWAASGANSSE